MADTPMNRIPRDQLPETFHLAWDTLNELTGEPAFVEVFSQAPDLLEFVMNKFYGDIFFAGRVENRYKQLVRLKLSMAHGCMTCNKQNVPGALEAGVSQGQIDSLDTFESGPFSDAEKAVLRLADEIALTNVEGSLDKGLYASLSEHFSDAEICELSIVAGVISGLAKMSFVLGLVEKEPYCPFAKEDAA